MKQPDPEHIPLRPRPANCPVPLTAGQLWSWNDMIRRGTRLSDLRRCAASVRVLGPLDTSLLRESIEAVVQRHESLRTRIVQVKGTPRQHIDAACDSHFEMIDLVGGPRANVEQEAKLLAEEFIERKIDLSVGQLFEAKLLRFSDREHVLILALDHIVSDAISWLILSKEIWTLYKQAARGQPHSLPQVALQFADYAVWQQLTYDAWMKKHGAFWKKRLAGAPRIQLPLDHRSEKMNEPTIAMLHIPLGQELSANLRDVALREKALLPLVVLTIYAAVVSRWCNQEDFVLAFMSHGRYRRRELENMIGPLATRLFFRMEVTNETSFLDLLKRATLEFYSAVNHQGLGLAPDIIPECTTDICFNWIPTNWSRQPIRHSVETHSQFVMQPFPIQQFRNVAATANSLAPMFFDTDAGIMATVLYRSDLLPSRRIESFGHNLRLFAQEFTRHPLASIWSVAASS